MGDRLRLLRTAYRLSQAKFAAAVDLSGVAISNMETGVAQNPYPSTLSAIAKKFGTTYEWLQDGSGDMLPNGLVNLAPADEISDTPWRDEAYQVMKQENTRLWDMVNKFMNGEINFLHPVNETAYSATGTFN